ncbi:MAG TPA: hypothetical protein PLS20_05495 [Ruminococcus flavefaciens]|nr:hypothetical protein [Ruminococcus flavefaciens]
MSDYECFAFIIPHNFAFVIFFEKSVIGKEKIGYGERVRTVSDKAY